MPKRITKYEQILSDARARVDAAKSELNRLHLAATAASAAVEVAAAELRGHVAAYEALERTLTPTPRKASTKKKQDPSPAAPTLLPDNEVKEPMCIACGHGPDYQDHFQPAPAYHPFESSARTASRRSSRKGSG